MNFIGKKDEDIEKENNLKWYIEFKPIEMFGFDLEEHKKLIEIFIKFLPKQEIQILKLNDGIVEESFELSYNETLENIKLLEKEEGKLYDKKCEISYSILTNNFFATILKGMVFWTSGKELAKKWEDALKNANLNFFEMDFVGGEDWDERKDSWEDEKDEEIAKNELWENKTKINGVWVDDETGEVLEGEG